MELNLENLPQEAGFIGAVIMVAICLNILLSAAGKVLDLVKDKTATQVDNKAASIVHTISGVLTKAIDFIGMNRPHK